ncbi:TIGR03986 family CRISPR-associated RAMP protein [Skermania piniformis]|uniref:TIGR03986 family CRISPR-associated RAMP protein n=1 Tax=Skermania pinensis TaxID=39122 RepID=A0ABX8SFN4_9ACTN|nr:TIGR03986 family CRISPR-associated RAMP protein [Skermania piniformis]QXQ14506.1 TIGR03986 family CRISPR-associated RAMP protein [Skermania piniformis]
MTVQVPNDPNRPQGPRTAAGVDQFINPYNFVSTPSRPKKDPTGLGNGTPAGHAAFVDGTYTGTIPITITTRTPLLLPDQSYATPASDEHPREVGTRTRGRHGEARTKAPLLTGSSVKGMLRSAYEAITNSTYGVVSETHNQRGSIRMIPKEALGLHPGVIEDDPNRPGQYVVKYVKHLRPKGWRGSDPLPAPHVPTTDQARFAKILGVAAENLDMQEVLAWIQLLKHTVYTPSGKPLTYHFWRVSDIAPASGALPATASNLSPGGRVSIPASPCALRVRGRLHWTYAPFAGKHDERLCVTELPDPSDRGTKVDFDTDLLRVGDDHRDSWNRILAAYLNEHDTESAAIRASSYGTYAQSATSAQKWAWRPGRTLHVGFDETKDKTGTKTIKTPWFTAAMVGRREFAVAAGTSIPSRNRPTTEYTALSPADRVFGWVRQEQKQDEQEGKRDDDVKGPRAYRGQLRVGAPTLDLAAGGVPAVEHFAQAVRLGILNSPKPTQYRFYGGDGQQRPRNNGRERNVADGYAGSNSRLRGRKFYLPQPEVFDGRSGASDYWDPSFHDTGNTIDVESGRRYREYLGVTPAADDNQLNKVAVAAKSWVRPGITFRTTLFVQNLTAVELGALLWLLALPDEASMTMGLGKPLGFGAVRVTADWPEVKLFTAADLGRRYRSLSDTPHPCAEPVLQELVTDYDKTLRGNAELARIRREYLDIAFGFVGVPVHYPRHRPIGQYSGRSAPQSELFKWWVANEQDKNYRYWLPEVGTDVPPTLPYLDEWRPR